MGADTSPAGPRIGYVIRGYCPVLHAGRPERALLLDWHFPKPSAHISKTSHIAVYGFAYLFSRGGEMGSARWVVFIAISRY